MVMKKTTKPLSIYMLRTAFILALFVGTSTALVALTYEKTRGKIAEAEREALLRSLSAVVSPDEYNNKLLTDLTIVTSKKLLGTDNPVPVFRARMDSKPVAVVLSPTAPKGYSGPIKLLIGIYYDGRVSGVRVLSHRETPGLGDAIEEKRSDWIHSFSDKSLDNLSQKNWKVKRDGGIFDQFTGATISPRAIVSAVNNTLLYFKEHRDELFEQKSTADIDKKPLTGK
jgi:electron transport complex protein RnfG